MRLLICVALMVLIFAACEHAGPLEVDPNDATFTNVQQSVFDTSCALSGCHAGDDPPPFGGGLNLEAGRAYDEIVGVASTENPALRRVAPGDPDNSYLVKKIQGDPDIAGQPMPLGRDPLSPELIDLVRRWIADGAQNN